MRQAGRMTAVTLAVLVDAVRPGITTRELDDLAFRTLTKQGASPSFKGYRGYPASLCASINDEVVHGIPDRRALKEGDIVSLDVGAFYQGYHGDSAVTVAVGKVGEDVQALLDATKAGLGCGDRRCTWWITSGRHLACRADDCGGAGFLGGARVYGPRRRS